jgi:hypothetical protein
MKNRSLWARRRNCTAGASSRENLRDLTSKLRPKFRLLPPNPNHSSRDGFPRTPLRTPRDAEVRCHGDLTRRRSTISSLKGSQPTDRRRAYRSRQHGARCGAACVWGEWSRPCVWGTGDRPGPCSDGDESTGSVTLRPDHACSKLSRLARPCAEPRRQYNAAPRPLVRSATILWRCCDAPGRVNPMGNASRGAGAPAKQSEMLMALPPTPIL